MSARAEDAPLEAVLTHLHNWFPAKGGRRAGTFAVRSGALCADFLAPGQYARIAGSALNDGLCRGGDGGLRDEVFTGEVWALAIPPAVVALAREIAAYDAEHPASDKTGERFGGYAYTRGGDGGLGGWQAAFAARLAPYRRIYDDG